MQTQTEKTIKELQSQTEKTIKEVQTQVVQNRLAIIAIIIKDKDKVDAVNSLLHEFARYNCGRLGLPCQSRNLAVICVIIDAPSDCINSLTGKLGMISGVKAKTLYE